MKVTVCDLCKNNVGTTDTFIVTMHGHTIDICGSVCLVRLAVNSVFTSDSDKLDAMEKIIQDKRAIMKWARGE